MKQCPSCSRTYDDVESFCYDDGTPLVFISQSGFEQQGQPTVVLSPTSQQVIAPQSSSATKWIFLLLGLLIAAFVAIGFMLFTRLSFNEANRAVNAPTNTTTESKESPTPETKVKSKPIPTSPNLTDRAYSPTPETKVESIPVQPPKPPTRSYPRLRRLKFARGLVAINYSDYVNSNDARSFVLACRAGQQMSATLSSDNGCVTFASGGQSYSALTSSGDNYLTVKNNCSDTIEFWLRVTIL